MRRQTCRSRSARDCATAAAATASCTSSIRPARTRSGTPGRGSSVPADGVGGRGRGRVVWPTNGPASSPPSRREQGPGGRPPGRPTCEALRVTSRPLDPWDAPARLQENRPYLQPGMLVVSRSDLGELSFSRTRARPPLRADGTISST
jgi:hypothetical protein